MLDSKSVPASAREMAIIIRGSAEQDVLDEEQSGLQFLMTCGSICVSSCAPHTHTYITSCTYIHTYKFSEVAQKDGGRSLEGVSRRERCMDDKR